MEGDGVKMEGDGVEMEGDGDRMEGDGDKMKGDGDRIGGIGDKWRDCLFGVGFHEVQYGGAWGSRRRSREGRGGGRVVEKGRECDQNPTKVRRM